MPAAPRGSGGSASFPCPDCDKTFSRKEYMARHYRSKHSRETPFQCEYCQRAFSRSDLLRRHYKTCAQAKAQRGPNDPHDSESPNDPVASTSALPVEAQLPYPGGAQPSLGLPRSASSSHSPYDPDLVLPVPPASFTQSSAPGPSYTIQRPSPANSQLSPLYDVSPYSLPTNSSTSTLATSSGSPDYPQKDLYPPDPPPSSNAQHLQLPSGLPASPHIPSGFAASTQLPPPPAPAPHLLHYPPIGRNSAILPEPPRAQPTSSVRTVEVAAPAPIAAAPSSAFKYGGFSFAHDTLAPGLSRTGSFTKDEVLASEVLRDLMRSPLGLPGVAPHPSPMHEMPWHGAKAAARAQQQQQHQQQQPQQRRQPEGQPTDQQEQRAQPGGGGAGDASGQLIRGNEAVALVDSQDWAISTGFSAPGTPSSVQVSNKLETSPAAQALASYFNQGGVGGITALDLGFPTEPSLLPDFMFQPQIVHEEDKRYWLPEQKFCLGYLYPWHVPPVHVLSSYARKATEKLLPAMPVIHAASVNLNEMPAHTAFALTVAGGAYEREGQSFSNEMLVEKRVFLVRGFQDAGKTWEERFSSMQSLLLYQLLGLFHRDEQQRLLSHSFHSALIFMLRSLDLPAKVKSTSVTPPRVGMQGDELHRAWQDWVKVETWRRVNFIVFLADLEYATATKSAQLLSLSDMDLDLPAVDRAWNSQTAGEWLEHMLSPFAPPPMSFLAALRALMSRTEPPRDPFSDQAVLLAELSRISSFPLLILSRTLSFLEKKTEEAIEQMDPFKNFLNGTGVIDGKDAENRDVLARIRSGRQYLRRLPGGLARGGGERWFEEVIPSAAGYTCSKSCTPEPNPRVSPESLGRTEADSTTTAVEDIFAEFEPQPYKPFYGPGGAQANETYEQAQARLQRQAERTVHDVQMKWPQFMN
ncbi:hypothetical protein JCM10908_007078 [Rhodotorula pacifica]|uniref:uncharacterized protein n=1 Tax=Rhodotorula pacifica TaxID=1495444 RepID=UPI00317700B5